jgi:RNA polymerase sigma-70 factor (ECF subfamily)
MSAARRPPEVAETHAVFDAIAALPADFRDVLVAIDVVGLSYRECARLLGVREATVPSRLHRARARVAAELAPEGKDSAEQGVR